MRARYKGFYDLGKVRVPPLPQFIVMEDRTTATQWLLSREIDDGVDRVMLTDTFNLSPYVGRVYFYGPNDGPYIATNPIIKLFVDNGILGYEEAELPRRLNLSIMARKGVERRVLHIYAPDGWLFGDELVFEVIN